MDYLRTEWSVSSFWNKVEKRLLVNIHQFWKDALFETINIVKIKSVLHLLKTNIKTNPKKINNTTDQEAWLREQVNLLRFVGDNH